MKIGISTNLEDEFKYWCRIPEYYNDGTRQNKHNGNLVIEMHNWAVATVDTHTWFRSRNQFTFQNEDDRLLFLLRCPK